MALMHPNGQFHRVFIVGVGMTPFTKPGSSEKDYPQLASEAIHAALEDAKVAKENIEQAVAGYVFGDSTCGQRAVYQAGLMSGLPVYNVNNNCSTGSTALFMAYQFIKGGLNQAVLAVGFEKMERGSLSAKYTDRTNPIDKHMNVMLETHGMTRAPFAPAMFGAAGQEHMKKYGTTPVHFAKIAEKNHRHSVNNPYSQFRDSYSLDEILSSPMIYEPLTKLQCSPTSDGAAAAVVVSEEFVHKFKLEDRAVEIVGMAMATDLPSSFNEKSMIKAVGFDMTRKAVTQALAQSNLTPNDIQVVELHDCFSTNELLTYEALGLCPIGKGGEFVDRGDNDYGGKVVVNPSGGLISKGHPLGATGLAQAAELNWQIRGWADKRQVAGAEVCLQHNLGLGGAVVITIYKKPEFASYAPPPADLYPTIKKKSSPTPVREILASTAIFQQLAGVIKTQPEIAQKINAVLLWNIKNGNATATWTLDGKSATPSLTQHKAENADVTLTMTDEDFVKLAVGKAQPEALFMSGKIKLSGDISKALMLGDLLKALPKPAL